MHSLPAHTKTALILLLALPVVALPAAAGVLAQSAAASSAPPAEEVRADPGADAKVAAADPNERICKNMQVTGSRFGRKVCHTREQWDVIDGRTRDAMRDLESTPHGWNEGN